MSLMGSFTLIGSFSPAPQTYQLDFVTPGSRPTEANSRKQIRHTPNFRMYDRPRPHKRQRFTARTSNFGVFCALTIRDFFAMSFLLDARRA
jgi:hypothetical protein